MAFFPVQKTNERNSDPKVNELNEICFIAFTLREFRFSLLRGFKYEGVELDVDRSFSSITEYDGLVLMCSRIIPVLCGLHGRISYTTIEYVYDSSSLCCYALFAPTVVGRGRANPIFKQ